MLLTMECLFSLLNGDDMYPTFTKVNRSSGTAVLIFSKLYLYGFISFFIYVVLSTFISIVGDTYERLKVSLQNKGRSKSIASFGSHSELGENSS